MAQLSATALSLPSCQATNNCRPRRKKPQLGGEGVPATVTVTGSITERGTLFFKARLGKCVPKSSSTSRARLVGLGMLDMAKEVEKMCGEPGPPKAYTNLLDKFAAGRVQGGGASTSTEPAPEEGMRTRNNMEPPEKRMRTRKRKGES